MPRLAEVQEAATRRAMARGKEAAWSLVGLAAVALAGWLLVRDVRGLSVADIAAAFAAIPLARWLAALASAALAYFALANYDRLALEHLGHRLDFRYVAVAAFTSYALGHNLGAPVLTGGLARYRAYSAKGLSAWQVGAVVAFTSATFTLGALLTGGLALLARPALAARGFDGPPGLGIVLAALLLAGPWLYVAGALFHLPPLRVGGVALVYPRPPIAAQQMLIAPLEILGAAGIVYFALPEAANPGFLDVLGAFLAAFSAGLISHAPGGLGVLELTFLKAAPEIPAAPALAALLAFRLLYLLGPLAISLVIAAEFERRRWAARRAAQ